MAFVLVVVPRFIYCMYPTSFPRTRNNVLYPPVKLYPLPPAIVHAIPPLPCHVHDIPPPAPGYAVGVARATSVLGPWEKLGAPVVHTRGGRQLGWFTPTKYTRNSS